MNSDKQVKANFESRFSLIINNQLVIGSFVSFPEGSISINPAPESDGKYTSGTEVRLTVRSNTGYDWKSWSGASSDTSNPTMVIMSGSNKNVTVNFEGRFSLTVSNQLVIDSVVYFSDGSISVDPAPGDDGKYAYGTRVTLTANPDTGYGWKSWSGTGSDKSNPAAVTINSEKHVAVTFEARYLVTINNQAMTGASIDFTGGSASANPAPGADGRFTRDTITLLTATPAAGYRFDKWSGDVSDKVTAVSIMMNNNKNITVTFIKVYTLTTTKSPGEGGTITPASGTYDEGTSVILNATAAAGYRFDQWSGDASDNITSFTVTFNADKNITANFMKVYTLTTSVSPAEGGTITPSGGIYDAGTAVTLTAVPATGYTFDHWDGDASGNTTSTSIIMSADSNVIASFVPSP